MQYRFSSNTMQCGDLSLHSVFMCVRDCTGKRLIKCSNSATFSPERVCSFNVAGVDRIPRWFGRSSLLTRNGLAIQGCPKYIGYRENFQQESIVKMKMNVTTPILLFALFGLLALVVGGPSVRAESNTYPSADSAESALTLDEGPHVFWRNDSSAVVFYYCDSEMVRLIFPVEDTLRFHGFCKDSSIQYVVPPGADDPPLAEFEGVSKWMAISDIHGDFEHLAEILVNSGVIDSAHHWTWGEGHLIINGDVTDRGAWVTECLWLIYHLEQEAKAAGGAVHFVLGNHELMVVRGDLRYVHQRYLDGIARRNRTLYDDLFGPDMELGRWMQSKLTLLRINQTLFVHGGIAPLFVDGGYDIAKLNDLVRRGLGYSSPRAYFSDTTKLLFGSLGPLWYRGYFMEMEGRYFATTSQQIDSQLTYYGVENVVVGHSQQDSITTFHDGRVIAIDVRVDELGGQQALLWQDSMFYRVDASGETRLLE